MSEPRRVAIAFALSVLLHVILFTLLALTPEPKPVENVASKDDQTMEVTLMPLPKEEVPPKEEPLPKETPKPDLAKEETPKPELAKDLVAVASARVMPVQREGQEIKANRGKIGDEEKAGTVKPGKTAVVPMPKAHSPKKATPVKQAKATAAVEAPTPSLAPALTMPENEPTPVLPKPTPISAPHAVAMNSLLRATFPRPTPLPVPQASPTPAPAPPVDASSPAPANSGDNGLEDPGANEAITAWKNAVGNAVGSCWNFYRQSKLDLLAVGEVRIKFVIDARGHASDMRIISNSANPTNAIYAVRSVKEAEFPPIPPERLGRLRGQRVEIVLTLTIYPTQWSSPSPSPNS